jgi:hypothetical protein
MRDVPLDAGASLIVADLAYRFLRDVALMPLID